MQNFTLLMPEGKVDHVFLPGGDNDKEIQEIAAKLKSRCQIENE